MRRWSRTWPDFRPLFPVPASQSPLVIPPASPFVSIAPNAGRLPRIFQWSAGFQREILRDLVVDAAYVGNRGAWWVSPLLAGFPNYNALTPEGLKSQYGLDVTNRTDVVVLGIIIYALLGKLADVLTRGLERRALAWHPAYQNARAVV